MSALPSSIRSNSISRYSSLSGALLFSLFIVFPNTAISQELDPIAVAARAALSAYSGEWRRIPDDGAETERIANITTALSNLSWIVRRMASGVLEKSTAPPEKMNFAWDGERLHQVVTGANGDFSRPVQLGGEPLVRTDDRGEHFTSHWTFSESENESRLQVHWVQDQAFGSNLYRLDPKDQTLVVEHRIHVTAISDIAPIVYHSRFDRAVVAAVSAPPPPETTTATLR